MHVTPELGGGGVGVGGAGGRAAGRAGVARGISGVAAATHAARRGAVELCAAAGLQVMTVPAYSDIVSGKVSVSALRNVELDDLLGRDPVTLDDAGLHALLGGKRVMVTGAGGSIGSELCRQIARYAPQELILFEISEFALYSIEQEFRDRFPELPVAALIGDAKSEARVNEVFARHAPQVVFHAAAYKHVPLMEDGNAAEAVANNVLSTVTLARAAQAARIPYTLGVLSAITIEQAAEIAPVMGRIGTLLGLVQMLGRLDDPSSIGPAMAVALLTTFYGAVLAHVFLAPIAAKLERNSREEILVKNIYALSAASIARQENPRRLELLLNTLLPPSKRVQFFD